MVMFVYRNDARNAGSSAGGTDAAGSAGWNAATGPCCSDDCSSNHRTAGSCSATTCTWSVTLNMSLWYNNSVMSLLSVRHAMTIFFWLSARSRSLTTISAVLFFTLISPQPPSSEKHSLSHPPNHRATVFFSFLLLVFPSFFLPSWHIHLIFL